MYILLYVKFTFKIVGKYFQLISFLVLFLSPVHLKTFCEGSVAFIRLLEWFISHTHTHTNTHTYLKCLAIKGKRKARRKKLYGVKNTFLKDGSGLIIFSMLRGPGWGS